MRRAHHDGRREGRQQCRPWSRAAGDRPAPGSVSRATPVPSLVADRPPSVTARPRHGAAAALVVVCAHGHPQRIARPAPACASPTGASDRWQLRGRLIEHGSRTTARVSPLRSRPRPNGPVEVAGPGGAGAVVDLVEPAVAAAVAVGADAIHEQLRRLSERLRPSSARSRAGGSGRSRRRARVRAPPAASRPAPRSAGPPPDAHRAPPRNVRAARRSRRRARRPSPGRARRGAARPCAEPSPRPPALRAAACGRDVEHDPVAARARTARRGCARGRTPSRRARNGRAAAGAAAGTTSWRRLPIAKKNILRQLLPTKRSRRPLHQRQLSPATWRRSASFTCAHAARVVAGRAAQQARPAPVAAPVARSGDAGASAPAVPHRLPGRRRRAAPAGHAAVAGAGVRDADRERVGADRVRPAPPSALQARRGEADASPSRPRPSPCPSHAIAPVDRRAVGCRRSPDTEPACPVAACAGPPSFSSGWELSRRRSRRRTAPRRRLHLLLAAADAGGHEVERVAPELVRGDVGGVRADAVDAEVAEVEPGPVPGEPAGDRAVVERRGHGRARASGSHRRSCRRTDAARSPLSIVLAVGRDGAFEDRRGRSPRPAAARSTGAAQAGLDASSASSAVAAATRICQASEPSLPRGLSRPGRRQVSWLPGLPPRLPGERCSPVAPSPARDASAECDGCSRSQWRDRAGLAPDFPLSPRLGTTDLKAAVYRRSDAGLLCGATDLCVCSLSSRAGTPSYRPWRGRDRGSNRIARRGFEPLFPP